MTLALHYAFGFDLERIGAAALRVSYDRITLAKALERTLAAGNLLPAPGSETWTGTNATVTTGIADPAGGAAAVTIADASAAASGRADLAAVPYVGANTVWVSLWVEKDLAAPEPMTVVVNFNSGFDPGFTLDPVNGVFVDFSGLVEAHAVTELAGWWFVAARCASTSGAATTVSLRVIPANSAAAATASCTIYGARIADATVDPIGADITRPETIDVRLDAGTFVHITPPSEVEHSVFATGLAAAINGTAGVHGTHTVAFDPASGYELGLDEQFALEFSTVATPAEGTRMREILGLSGDVEADGSFVVASDVRPHYFIVPATQGRTGVSDEYEPDDVVSEDVTDGGETDEISRDVDEVWLDWDQTGEDPLDLGEAFDPATPVYEKHETAAIPWSYQRAWTHHQRGFDPIIVTEGSEVTAHRLRAEGASFKPERMASDYDMWSIAFRTRLLGRVE